MSLSRMIRGEFTLVAAVLAAIAVLAGTTASVRLESDRAESLWLIALGLMLAPSLPSSSVRMQVALGSMLAAIGLFVATAAFGIVSAWIAPLTMIAVGGSLAIRLRPAELPWLVPGSACSLLILMVVAAGSDGTAGDSGAQIAGAILAAITCASAFAIIDPRASATWPPAACLIAATATSIRASLDASLIWPAATILLAGSSLLMLPASRPRNTWLARETAAPQPGPLAIAGCCLATGAAVLVAAVAGDIDLRWPILAIVAAGLAGIVSVGFQWRASLVLQLGQFERARRESRTDPLTGLANRRGIEERLGTEIARSLRFDHELSLLMIDLDDFKTINDRFGHAAGDVLLRATARAIDEAIRSIDLAGRYGGEEFLVILPETTCSGAEVVAERIRLAVEQIGEATASIGVASLGNEDTNSCELIERADAALFDAKRAGKNRVVLSL